MEYIKTLHHELLKAGLLERCPDPQYDWNSYEPADWHVQLSNKGRELLAQLQAFADEETEDESED